MRYFIIEDLFVVRMKDDGSALQRFDRQRRQWVAYDKINTVNENGRQVDRATARRFIGGGVPR